MPLEGQRQLIMCVVHVFVCFSGELLYQKDFRRASGETVYLVTPLLQQHCTLQTSVLATGQSSPLSLNAA